MFGRRKKKKKTQEQLNREDFVFKVWILSIFLCSATLYLTSRNYNSRLLNLFIIIFFTGVALFAPAYFYPKMDWYYKLANNKLPNDNPNQSSTYIVIYNLVWFAALFIAFSVSFNVLYIVFFIDTEGLQTKTIPPILSLAFRLLSFITALALSIRITENKKKKLGGLNKKEGTQNE